MVVAQFIDTRGPGFESSHRQLLLNNYLLLIVGRKDKNKVKEAGNYPFKNSIVKDNARVNLLYNYKTFLRLLNVLDSNPDLPLKDNKGTDKYL